MMAAGRDMATAESSRTPKPVALPQLEAPSVETVPLKEPVPGSFTLANGASIPITLLEDPTALVGVSSLHSEDATLQRR